MTTTITMPSLGESVAEGEIGKWLVTEGQRVEKDQPLVEVLTDKADSEIPATSAGVVTKIFAPQGAMVAVGDKLCEIDPAAQAGDGATAKLAARQVAPGRYQARVTADARQPLTVSSSEAGAAAPPRFVLPDPNAEYRFNPGDVVVLKSIATATGGAWHPAPEALRDTAGSRQTVRRALWPALVVFGLVMWLVDVLMRRVRVFETSGVIS